MSESQIVTLICEYLFDIKGYFGWRQNNTAIYDRKANSYRKFPEHCKKGVPDIIVIINGEFIALEVKDKGKYLSKDQKKFKEDLEMKGGSKNYHLVRSIQDVQNIGL